MGLISSKNIFLCIGNYMQMSVNTGTHMKMSEKLERGPPQDNNSTFIQTDAAKRITRTQLCPPRPVLDFF